MRALLALALLAVALPAASAACEARLCADVGHPGPGVRVVVHQHPDCLAHALLWDGAWMSAADAATWAWGGASLAGTERLDDRADAATLRALAEAMDAATQAGDRAPSWMLDPLAAPLWAVERAGDEDVCAIGVVELTTGVQG